MPQLLSHYFHGHKIHYTEMNELYISISLRALALGVGGLFVPLFLFDIGYSLLMIAGFYIFSMASRLPIEIIAGKMIGLIGAKHTLTISYISLFLHFVTLYAMQFFPWLWPLAALFLAIEMSLFWIGFHFLISKARSKKNASSQIGLTLILKRLFMALGPLAGGVVAALYGVELTLLLAAAILILASYPLFQTPDVQNQKFRVKDLRLGFGRDSAAHFVWQISGVVASYLWPLWLLFVLGNYSQIGLIIALSIMVGIGLTFWVGKMGDKGYNSQFLKYGSIIKSISHWLRVVSSSFGLAFIASAFNDMGDNLSQGPFTEKYYEAADKGERFLYILKMNITSVLGKLSGWIILFLLALVLSEMAALQAMFIVAAITIPAMVWVSHRSLKHMAPAHQPGVKSEELA